MSSHYDCAVHYDCLRVQVRDTLRTSQEGHMDSQTKIEKLTEELTVTVEFKDKVRL